MMDEYISIIKDLGFPIFIACALLWDKMKTNGSMLQVVKNNNSLLNEIKNKLK